MTSEYDKKFIFNVLKSQINSRLKWEHPDNHKLEEAAQLFWDSICDHDIMYINKVKLPDIRWITTNLWYGWPMIYADSLMIHHLFNDDYSVKNVSMMEEWGTEGPYGFENIVVDEGDTVIDAGAYIGDWSAVAAQMGGNVYAFEPSPFSLPLLQKTADMNKFNVVGKGLGDSCCQKLINTSQDAPAQNINDTIGVPCEIITIDEFATKNDLKIDFIKADIEGYEIQMLQGAAKIIARDGPKLAIRTYHHKGRDAQQLLDLVPKLNPNYKVIMRKFTLYAYVP